jgi:hypothetical protein
MAGSWAAGLLGVAMFACAPLGISPATKAFTEGVLQPLAAQQAEERISQARSLLAQINLAKERLAAGQPLTPETQTLLNGIVGLLTLNPGDPRGTDVLLAFVDAKAKKPLAARKVAYQEALAWIDSRRLPLQREILRRLADRAVRTNKGFAVCVDGIQRQYETGVEGRFVRLADKPGAC